MSGLVLHQSSLFLCGVDGLSLGEKSMFCYCITIFSFCECDPAVVSPTSGGITENIIRPTHVCVKLGCFAAINKKASVDDIVVCYLWGKMAGFCWRVEFPLGCVSMDWLCSSLFFQNEQKSKNMIHYRLHTLCSSIFL
jgi:hypothetical protein